MKLMIISELQRHEDIHAITDGGKFSAVYQLPHQLLSLEQYVQVIDESRQQIRDGSFLTVEDLERESEGW